ncbi:hypothetical protein [Roseococcus pinisoli]|uniref:Uncharacterized protein n=1 Tax=Roseococcus pinisoli TaxID=2835040 RepID=A0ABS5QHD9_9PROT|nr:hypothetical protein [Roseococcus pinisoli]MBS7812347.1 hypothetical protein [Roseococcus pinisoli]
MTAISVPSATKKLRLLLRGETENHVEIGRYLRLLNTAVLQEAIRRSGLTRRRAYYFIAISRAIDDGLISEASVALIGWVKARALCAVARRTGKPVPKADILSALRSSKEKVHNQSMVKAGCECRSSITFTLGEGEGEELRELLARFGWSQGDGPTAKTLALLAMCRTANQIR